VGKRQERRCTPRSIKTQGSTAQLEPQISWGTDPSQVVGISDRVPDVANARASRRAAMESAYDYMGVAPGAPLRRAARSISVFIGSMHQCAATRP